MSSASHIDPRLRYNHAPHPYPHQPIDAVRRAQQLPLPQQHQGTPNLPHQRHSDINTSPHQPYYDPHSQGRPLQTPAPPGQVYDPTLEEGESPSAEAEDHPSPLEQGNIPNGSADSKTQDPKRSRACDSCRGLKVKCDFSEPGNSRESCKRCAKARRPCIVTPATRRRQKKADGRVAELERKVDALTARLAEKVSSEAVPEGLTGINGKRSASPSHISVAGPDQGLELDVESHSPDKRRRLSKADAPNPPPAIKDVRVFSNSDGPTASNNLDIYNQGRPKHFDHSDIDRKIFKLISPAKAEQLFDRYVNTILPLFPAVVFSEGTTAEHIRKTKPILFLAILSSTCYGASVPTRTQEALEELLRDVLADSVWKKGEKSLEIIQSLQVATLWYRPPNNFEQHMFYQMVHWSATMAIDIGVGKKVAPARRKMHENARRLGVPGPESAEVRRAWLTSYYLCTSISMILRRSIVFKHVDYMRDCVEYLESDKTEDAQPSDRILCQHVRLAHIAEDVTARFALDDPTVNLSISDSKVTYGIKHFEEDLANVMTGKGPVDLALKLGEHVTSLYLHEIALHSQQNAEDFKTPFMDETFKAGADSIVQGPHHVDALTACQSACHGILDTFLENKVETLYLLPVLFSVRCLYAIVTLIKLYMAAKAPGEMSSIIKIEDLRVDSYIERLRKVFEEFKTRDPKCPQSKFLWVTTRLASRFDDIQKGDLDPGKAISAKQAAQMAATQRLITPGKSPSARSMERKEVTIAPHHASGPAQGLQLLSEAAMGGNATHTGPSRATPTQPPMQQPHTQGWYQPASSTDMTSGMPMDPVVYNSAYGPMAVGGFETFDYGLGAFGMGADGGLFMADSLWGYGEPFQGMHPGGGGWP